MNKKEQKKEQVLLGFRELYNKMVWLNKSKMEKSLKGQTSSEVHCIECIENNVDPNVTKLAECLYLTTGAISKMTKKLIKKGLIESYKKSDNKKEIYFRLTKQGKVVYRIHEDLHTEFQERDKEIFAQVTEQQFDSMFRFLEKYSKHLDDEIKKQGIVMKAE